MTAFFYQLLVGGVQLLVEEGHGHIEAVDGQAAHTRLDMLAIGTAGQEREAPGVVSTMLDRLTNFNWGEGVVDFKMYNNQVERLVNNLTARYLPGRAWKVIKRMIVRRHPVLGTSFNCITSSITCL